MKYLKYIGLLIAFFMIASCGGSGGGGGSGDAVKAAAAGDTSTVALVLGGTQGAGLVTEDNTLIAFVKDIIDFFGPAEATAFIPLEVQRVRVIISGSNFTIMDDFTIEATQEEVLREYEVPNGDDIEFRALSFNLNDIQNYEGVTIESINGPTRVQIFMKDAEPSLNPSVYVSNAGGDDQLPDDVSAIDPLSFLEQRLNCSGVTGAACQLPYHLAVSFDGSRALVPFSDSDEVLNIATSVPELDGEIADSFNEPEAVAFRCDDKEAWVPNNGNDSVSIIDTSDDSVFNLTTGEDPCSFDEPRAIAMAGANAYIANVDGTICVVDMESKVILDTIVISGVPRYAEATPDGAYVFISTDIGVFRIATSSDSIQAFTPTGAHQLATSRNGLKMFVAIGDGRVGVITEGSGGDNLAIIDFTDFGADSTLGVEVFEVNGDEWGFASEENGENDGLVYVFDPSNNAIVTYRDLVTPVTIPVGIHPVSIASQPFDVSDCGPFIPDGEIQLCDDGDFDEGDTDAPGLPGGRFVLGSGSLSRIVGRLDDMNDADMYEIFIDDPDNFRASTYSNDGGSAEFNSQLFLFSSDGTGVYANDDFDNDESASILPAGFTQFPTSTYFLVITSSPNHPTSTEGSIGPIFPPDSGTDVVGPIDPDRIINDYSGGDGSSGAYSISINGAVCIEPE